jgi:uncharacterized NAD-dependent epimerase/dehydratase family protein
MRGLPDYPLPDLAVCLEANLVAARLTNPAVRPIGVALNTSGMLPEQARLVCVEVSEMLGLPCQDPVTMGVDAIVDNLLACFAN